MEISAKADSMYSVVVRAIEINSLLADSLCRDMMAYSKKLNNKEFIGYAMLADALLAKEQDNYNKGITLALGAINLLDSVKQIKKVCVAYQALAHLYNRTSNFKLASDAAYKALWLAETTKDPALLFDAYNFLGISLIREKKFDEAKRLYRKAISIAKGSHNLSQQSRVYTNMGIAYRNLQQWDSALYYHRESYAIASDLNNKYDIAFALNDIGVIYLRIDDYNKALEYLFESVKIREEMGEKWELGFTYNFIGECYANLGNLKDAERYIRKAIAVSYLSKNVRQRYESYDYISAMKSMHGQYDSAFYFLQKHNTLKDSFQRARNNFMTEALIASYQAKEKEKEIALLNEVSSNQSLQIQRQRLYLIVAIVVLLFLTTLVVFIFRSRKQAASKLRLESQLKEESIKRLASESMQKEKARISRDLHDNVGGQLSYVLYSLDGFDDDDKMKRAELSKNINESIRTVVGNLRETIWVLNDESISIQDLSDRLKVYAKAMFKNTSVRLTFNEDISRNSLLRSSVGLNLFRICQEIINNAFKHSCAGNVNVDISSIDDSLSIVISDDGKGFVVGEGSKNSFGLSNIKARSHEAGISIELLSQPGCGTTVKLLV